MKNLFLWLVVFTILGFGFDYFLNEDEMVACTMEAKLCPDGSAVGRTGPNCEFAACPEPNQTEVVATTSTNIPADIASHIASKADLIKLTSPQPLETVSSTIEIKGEARGYWFFEASFPIVAVDWDGRIVGEGIATADGDWMTEDFVPFTAKVEYYIPDDIYSKNGALILKRDNPSGLPENDDALEIPVIFE